MYRLQLSPTHAQFLLGIFLSIFFWNTLYILRLRTAEFDAVYSVPALRRNTMHPISVHLEFSRLLGYYDISTGEYLPTYRKSVLSSHYHSSKDSLNLKMEALRLSEKSVTIHQSTRRNMPEDPSIHQRWYGNLKSPYTRSVPWTAKYSEVLEFTCQTTRPNMAEELVLTLRWLMSYIYIYIYGAPILDVSRSHTTTQHSR